MSLVGTKPKEIKITNEYYSIKIGVTDKKKPNVVYCNVKSRIKPINVGDEYINKFNINSIYSEIYNYVEDIIKTYSPNITNYMLHFVSPINCGIIGKYTKIIYELFINFKNYDGTQELSLLIINDINNKLSELIKDNNFNQKL